MLYIVGLGLGDEKDITVKGLEAVRKSERVYLEAYTSIMGASKEKLEAFYEKPLILADRDLVESESDSILSNAASVDVAFLVVGDPFGATTHTDLVLRAKELNIPVHVIHNASIMNAVGALGLALYNYGQTVSIPFFTETWKPASWSERIFDNMKLGLHTLCLLDIKVKEQSEENLARGRKIFEPPRFMSTHTAVDQLLSVLPPAVGEDEDGNEVHNYTIDPKDTLAISCSKLGSEEQRILAGSLREFADADPDSFGGPLHSFVILGKRFHPVERDFGAQYAINPENWQRIADEVYQCR